MLQASRKLTVTQYLQHKMLEVIGQCNLDALLQHAAQRVMTSVCAGNQAAEKIFDRCLPIQQKSTPLLRGIALLHLHGWHTSSSST